MNIQVTKKNFNSLDVGIKVLFALILASKKSDGTIDLDKAQMSDKLKISRQTVGKHVKTFAECNMLKYKFSGQGMLNPDFYYMGAPDNLCTVREQYLKFKSDV